MYYTNFQNSRGNIRREEDPNPNEQPRRKRARGEQQTDEQTQNQSEQQSHPDEQQQTETGKHEQEQQQTETGKHEQDDNKHQQNEQTDEQQTETGSHDLQQQDEQGDEHPLPHPPNPPEVFPQSLTEREVNKNDTENLLCTDICRQNDDNLPKKGQILISSFLNNSVNNSLRFLKAENTKQIKRNTKVKSGRIGRNVKSIKSYFNTQKGKLEITGNLAINSGGNNNSSLEDNNTNPLCDSSSELLARNTTEEGRGSNQSSNTDIL